jgi:hypothetical protein
MNGDNGYPVLAAYLVSVLVRNDRGIRAVGPPRNRQEWGIDRVGEYLRAIGQETIEEGGEAALWTLLRGSVALLPSRREEALLRLVRHWGAAIKRANNAYLAILDEVARKYLRKL